MRVDRLKATRRARLALLASTKPKQGAASSTAFRSWELFRRRLDVRTTWCSHLTDLVPIESRDPDASILERLYESSELQGWKACSSLLRYSMSTP